MEDMEKIEAYLDHLAEQSDSLTERVKEFVDECQTNSITR